MSLPFNNHLPLKVVLLYQQTVSVHPHIGVRMCAEAAIFVWKDAEKILDMFEQMHAWKLFYFYQFQAIKNGKIVQVQVSVWASKTSVQTFVKQFYLKNQW